MPVIGVFSFGVFLFVQLSLLAAIHERRQVPPFWAAITVLLCAAPITVCSRKTDPILLELDAKNYFNTRTTNN